MITQKLYQGALFILVTLLATFTPSECKADITLTGTVPTDFTEFGVITVVDSNGIPDVGIPSGFPLGTVSGVDLAEVRFFLNVTTDTLYVGMNTFTIAGDVDDDGDPGGTSSPLAGLGGQDSPDFGGTESFAVMLDLDEDGIFDVIAGVSTSTDLSGFAVATFSGNSSTPGLAFGTPLPTHTGSVFASPSISTPDIEFTILNFSNLPTSSGSDSETSLCIRAFMGSYSDAGIGQDFVPSESNNALIVFPEPLALSILGVLGDTLTLSIENIPSGQTFHLRQSSDLTSFLPLSSPITFTDATPQPIAITVETEAHPALFFSAYAGASP
ncbi:MAG: hypothetical protein ACSHYB_05150 [Roseibacillus sp.]